MEKYGQLFESVFKRKLTDENAVGYLENITKEHPYFSVAQFYLLRLLEKDTNGYKKQARKTVALFNNSHWLNFQLIEAGYNTGVAETIVQSPILEPAPENFGNKTLTEEHIKSFCGAGQESSKIKVKMIDIKTDKVIKIWDSIKEASDNTDANYTTIIQVCRGYMSRKTSGGYKWKYV